MPEPITDLKKTVLILGGVAAVLAVIRYFLRSVLDPLGVPVVAGSFLASVTVVLLVAIGILFSREGRVTGGRYFRAAGWFVALAAWCEFLVIGGILVSETTGARTYYQGPWETVERTFPTATAHAAGHAQGFLFRTAVALILGGVVYAIARRGRAPAA